MLGRPLEDPELAGYDHIAPDLLLTVRVVKVRALTPGTGGMTLGHHIFLVDDSDRSGRHPLMAHELVHVRQFAEQGRTRFLLRYVRDYLRALRQHRRHRAAYLAIPAEVEARRETEAWATG